MSKRCIKVILTIDNRPVIRKILQVEAHKRGLELDSETGEVTGCHTEGDVAFKRECEEICGKVWHGIEYYEQRTQGDQ